MILFQRPQLAVLTARLRQPCRFLQILAGPRQVGKTTLARQAWSSGLEGFRWRVFWAPRSKRGYGRWASG